MRTENTESVRLKSIRSNEIRVKAELELKSFYSMDSSALFSYMEKNKHGELVERFEHIRLVDIRCEVDEDMKVSSTKFYFINPSDEKNPDRVYRILKFPEETDVKIKRWNLP